LRAGDDKASPVERNAAAVEPTRRRIGADEQEEVADIGRILIGREPALPADALERAIAGAIDCDQLVSALANLAMQGGFVTGRGRLLAAFTHLRLAPLQVFPKRELQSILPRSFQLTLVFVLRHLLQHFALFVQCTTCLEGSRTAGRKGARTGLNWRVPLKSLGPPPLILRRFICLGAAKRACAPGRLVARTGRLIAAVWADSFFVPGMLP
jgi:hypothetical protein